MTCDYDNFVLNTIRDPEPPAHPDATRRLGLSASEILYGCALTYPQQIPGVVSEWRRRKKGRVSCDCAVGQAAFSPATPKRWQERKCAKAACCHPAALTSRHESLLPAIVVGRPDVSSGSCGG
jgi:hypothetical protein